MNPCFIVVLTPSQKVLLKDTFVAYMMLLLLLMYAIYHFPWYRVRYKDSPKNKENFNFINRLSTGFMHALLFAYQNIAAAVFRFLHCVDMGNESVLFVDGNVTCCNLSRYSMLACAIVSVIPFV